jgi:hypothetical protein
VVAVCAGCSLVPPRILSAWSANHFSASAFARSRSDWLIAASFVLELLGLDEPAKRGKHRESGLLGRKGTSGACPLAGRAGRP